MFLKSIKIYLFFLLISLFSVNTIQSASENDFKDTNLIINLENNSSLSIKNVGEEEFIKGTIFGGVKTLDDDRLNNSHLECEFIGRAYKGRGFSCGFAIIEDLHGLCYINKKNKNTLILSWKCNTSAGLSGDASCLGKLNLMQGYGSFAGAEGFGTINMPLAKAMLKEKFSQPMKLKLSIKYPILLKKN